MGQERERERGERKEEEEEEEDLNHHMIPKKRRKKENILERTILNPKIVNGSNASKGIVLRLKGNVCTDTWPIRGIDTK